MATSKPTSVSERFESRYPGLEGCGVDTVGNGGYDGAYPTRRASGHNGGLEECFS